MLSTFRALPVYVLPFLLASVFAVATQDAHAGESRLYVFKGASWSYGGVIEDAGGNLYGTTSHGGKYKSGTVFKLSPNNKIEFLYQFGKPAGDPLAPDAGLIVDGSGNFYGTTATGGASNLGSVFKLTPGGKLTVLHSFTGGADGSNPVAGLIADSQGNLYGTTFGGGGTGCNGTGCGTVFKLTAGGTESVLHAFQSVNDGTGPVAGLVMDAQGNLYGTTESGGVTDCEGPGYGGCGTVFKVTPGGTESVLYAFDGGQTANDGAFPLGGLILDNQGNLYGTTWVGGPAGGGNVFALAPNGTETILYSFKNGNDGTGPLAGLVADQHGNLYGTTGGGGAGSGCSHAGCGIVFELSAGGSETVLHAFAGGNRDGALPRDSLILDSSGNLFGTTFSGGSSKACNRNKGALHGCGTVFEIAAPDKAKR